MPLHGDKTDWNLINYFKRRFLKEAASRIHDHFKPIIEDRKENGWARTTTPQLEEVFDECLGHWHPEVDSSDRKFNRSADRLHKLMQVGLVIYDSDDAYADVLHKFVEKCNNRELELEAGNRYLRVPVEQREDYEEELNKMDADHGEFYDFDNLQM